MKQGLLATSLAGCLLLAVLAGAACTKETAVIERTVGPTADRFTLSPRDPRLITLFLSGDVMVGRGIDQALPHPGDPVLHESYMKDARAYVRLAEAASGPMETPLDFAAIWGDALAELERVKPDVRIINLETSVTQSDDYWKGKGIHYRMNPQNVPCLTAAEIEVCSLANNHVLDWGYDGLADTLDTLRQAQIHTVGAGRDLQDAEAPAVIEVEGKGRVLVFAYASPTSGTPPEWAASDDKPGVSMVHDLSDRALARVEQRIEAIRQPGDVVVLSIHWGSNWGYDIPDSYVTFAHRLIDDAGVDVVHGHSSHHIRPIEVYRDRLILYGCGDFLNDYEGISGMEDFRADLAMMFFVTVDPTTGQLVNVTMTPMQMRRFRLNRASRDDAAWLQRTLNELDQPFGAWVEIDQDDRLTLVWD